MWAIVKKDFKSFFYSPIGYVAVAIFLALMAVFMYLFAATTKVIDFNYVYCYVAKFALPIIVAALTMKSFAEEKNKSTDNLLYTASRKNLPIIVGKVLAVVLVIFVAIVISFLYCLIFAKYGAINGRLFITIGSLILLTFAYASVGVLISSLTESQVIAALFTLVFLLLPSFFSYGDGIFSYLGLIEFYSQICDGKLSFGSIFAFVSFSITCIALATIEMKRNKKIN